MVAKSNDKWARLVQVFSARLVLEVFGGAGAIWGSEACDFRNTETVNVWRFNASTVGVVFFIRWLLQIKDFTAENDNDESDARKTKSLLNINVDSYNNFPKYASPASILDIDSDLAVSNTKFNFDKNVLKSAQEINNDAEEKCDQLDRFSQIYSARLIIDSYNNVPNNIKDCASPTSSLDIDSYNNVPNNIKDCASPTSILDIDSYFTISNTKLNFDENGWKSVQETNDDTEEKSNQYVKLFQIFSARLVLEVFGASGAIWGFSEICTFRRPETQEFWRHNAQIVAFIFFVRDGLQISDFVAEHNTDKTKGNSLLQMFSARLVLEVFGAGGAIWGFSEVMTFRRAETQEFWRHIATIVTAMFTVRFFVQVKDFIEEAEGATKKSSKLAISEQNPLVC